MPLRTVRVRQACFVCGGDLPLERFLRGLPCQECEEKAHRVQMASRPPQVVTLLAQQYQQRMGSPMPRVWQPWIAAVAARESLRIPLWPPYRTLEFFLFLAGTSRRPAVVVAPEADLSHMEDVRILEGKTPVFQRLPRESEVLLIQPRALAQIPEVHRFTGFLFWHHPDPPPEPSAFPSAVLVVADPQYPYPRLHTFQGWLAPNQAPPEREARVLDLPWTSGPLMSLPPEQLLSLLFLLLPFLPVELQELVVSLYARRSLDSARLQVLREALTQALERQGLKDILAHLGVLQEDLRVNLPDPEPLRHQMETLDHPEHRGPVYLTDPGHPRFRYLVHRGFLPHPPPLRQRPPLKPPRDTATLLVFVGDPPALRDLGFAQLWRRHTLGLDLLEGMGTLGPVTLVRVPPLFRWVDTTLYPEVALLKALRTLARRYPRITLMVPEPLEFQGLLLLAALSHLWNRRRLLLYSDFVSQRLQQVSLEDRMETIRHWHQRHLLLLEHRRSWRTVGISRTPTTWLQEAALGLIQRAQETAQPHAVALLTLDGLTLRLPLPPDLPGEEAERRIRQDTRIQMETGEFPVAPPPPASPGRLLEEGSSGDLRALIGALTDLWRAGLLSHPHRAVPVAEYTEVARVLLEGRGLSPAPSPDPDLQGLVPTRPLLDLDLRALASRYRVPPAVIPVYRRVLLRFLAQFLPPARVQATRVRVVTPYGTAEALKAQKIVDIGFTALLPLPMEFGVVYPDLQITRVRIQPPDGVGLPVGAFVDHWFFHPRENPNPALLLRSLEPWVRVYRGRLLLTPEGQRLVQRIPGELVEP